MKLVVAAIAALSLSTVAEAQFVDLNDSAFALGTLTRSEGALPDDLWRGADPDLLGQLLADLPRSYAEPAYLDLARRVLLSPATAPEGATDALAGAKLLAAAELGFYREAGDIAELAPQLSGQPTLTKVAALSALLDGDIRTACSRGSRLTQGRTDPFFLRLRYLCYVDAGEGAAADLTLGLLRDQGMLTEGADRVFTALQTSGDIGGSISPQDAFEYAATQMLGAEVSVAAISELPGSVLAATARDENADTAVRQPALERALALGLIGSEEGQRLVSTMAETPLAAEVVAVATARPGSPESALAVASSLEGAPSYDAFRARAVLFTDALRASAPEGVDAGIVGTMALGALMVGQDETAQRWLAASETVPGADPAAHEDVRALYDIAAGETRVVAVPLGDPVAATTTDVPRLVGTALPVARGGSAGAAALVALTGLGVAADDAVDAIREEVVLAMLRQSGMFDDLAARVAIDEGAAASFANDAVGGGAAETGQPVPRVKPEAP